MNYNIKKKVTDMRKREIHIGDMIQTHNHPDYDDDTIIHVVNILDDNKYMQGLIVKEKENNLERNEDVIFTCDQVKPIFYEDKELNTRESKKKHIQNIFYMTNASIKHLNNVIDGTAHVKNIQLTINNVSMCLSFNELRHMIYDSISVIPIPAVRNFVYVSCLYALNIKTFIDMDNLPLDLCVYEPYRNYEHIMNNIVLTYNNKKTSNVYIYKYHETDMPKLIFINESSHMLKSCILLKNPIDMWIKNKIRYVTIYDYCYSQYCAEKYKPAIDEYNITDKYILTELNMAMTRCIKAMSKIHDLMKRYT